MVKKMIAATMICGAMVNFVACQDAEMKSQIEKIDFQNTKENYNKKEQISSDTNTQTVGKEMGFDWVNLGTSVLWATCNVGANNPWEYGDYYAWGEIEKKTEYTENNYKFYDLETKTYTKYISKYNHLMKLQSEDDVAMQKWRGSWRMPTKEDFDELINNCIWQKTQIYKGKEVNGYIIFRKKREENPIYNVDKDSHIFLPTAGYSYLGIDLGLNSSGRYSSSSLDEFESSYNWGLFFSTSGIAIGINSRYQGSSVRPVCDLK